MPDIKITFEEVKEKTKQIRKHNENLTGFLQQIQSAINALEADWTSDTSDTIRSKITGMQKNFDTYKEVIESYARATRDSWTTPCSSTRAQRVR